MSHLPIIAAPDAASPRDPAPARREAQSAARDVRDEDLHDLLVDFYAAVAREPLLASYFEHVDMAEHIPRIADFWSTILFHSGRYSGNAFRPHMAMPGLDGPHFARWVATMEATVDASFAGPVAENLKALAHRIAYSMQLRLGVSPFTDFRPVR